MRYYCNFSVVPFTSEEKYQMKDLPNSEFLLDKVTLHSVYLGLVDIVYAFAYNHRINEGESNVRGKVYMLSVVMILILILG